MKYRFEGFAHGKLVQTKYFEGDERAAIATAKFSRTPSEVTFIRVVEDLGSENLQIWSERRDA